MDRDAAIALHVLRAETCPHCGTRHEEWAPTEGGMHAYRPTVRRCRGCEVVARGRKEIRAEDGDGQYVALIRNEEV